MAADLALVGDPGVVEWCADPAAFVMAACERANAWLREALEHGEIERIAELKCRADAIRAYTAQKQLGKDAELAAAEVVRRAERGIGVAIRRGQAAGEITRRGGHGGNQHRRAEPGKTGSCTAKPTDYASDDELSGNGAGIYHLTDGVSDGDFDDALGDAKAERNLSRANVVRKIRQRHCGPQAPGEAASGPGDTSPAPATRRRELIGEFAGRGMTSAQIGERLGTGADWVRAVAREHGIAIPADAVTGRARRPDSSRIVGQTADALEGLVMGLGLADPAGLDPAEAAEWAASMTRSLRVIGKFVRQMKEVIQ
jgi:hypothetical protein